eukprot:scaffold42843_cov16-Tisochrysis_lutea.AAC.1
MVLTTEFCHKQLASLRNARLVTDTTEGLEVLNTCARADPPRIAGMVAHLAVESIIHTTPNPDINVAVLSYEPAFSPSGLTGTLCRIPQKLNTHGESHLDSGQLIWCQFRLSRGHTEWDP